jgi:hypothetical protein
MIWSPKPRSFSGLSLVTVLAFGVWLQAAGRAVADGKGVPAGTWGGEHIAMEVSEKGADVEFDCAHGQITQPMALDLRGDFDVAGTFTPEHGGPVRRDENTPPASTRYTGHAAGDTMTLVVILGKEGKEKLGPFTLTRGARPNLRRCR